MVKIDVKVINLLGIHARTASKIVRTASKFSCSINAIKDGKTFNFKNVRGVMTSNSRKGDNYYIEFDGPDEEIASKEISQLFLDKFGEE